MRWICLIYLLSTSGGIAARSVYRGRSPADTQIREDTGGSKISLYGSSGKPELKDLDVISGSVDGHDRLVGPHLFAIIQAGQADLLKNQMKYHDDVDGRPAMTLHLWDKDLQRHTLAISQPDDAQEGWWWWAYLKQAFIYLNRTQDELFRPKLKEVTDPYASAIMRALTGRKVTTYHTGDNKVNSVEKLIDVLSRYKQTPMVLVSQFQKMPDHGEIHLASDSHYAIANVDMESKKIKLWRSLDSPTDLLHVEEYTINTVFEDFQELFLAVD